MIKLILSGYSGKMGQTVCKMCDESKKLVIVAGIAKDRGDAAFPTFTSPKECNIAGDVIIDFSNADNVEELLEFAVAKKIPIVVCTTGLSKSAGDAVMRAAGKIAVFRSANMSIAVNIMAKLLRSAAQALYPSGFDIELLEKHHNLKLDAPSGTAFLLADAMNDQLGGVLKYNFDRSQMRQKRSNDELGMHAVRGGTIVGEHSVIFAGADEVLEITHVAQSKAVFAKGALAAAEFIKGKPAGLYDMNDALAQ